MTMRSDVCQLFPGRTNGGEGEEARRPATPRRRRRPRLARANAAAGGRDGRSVERIGARRRPEAALGRQLARSQRRRRHGRPSRLCLRQRDMTCHFAAPLWPGVSLQVESVRSLSLALTPRGAPSLVRIPSHSHPLLLHLVLRPPGRAETTRPTLAAPRHLGRCRRCL
jgi:hypothetical protein